MCPSPVPSAPIPQERLEAARQALSEARKQSSSLGEQLQVMQGEMADLELQRAEAEGQLQQLQEVRARADPFCPRDAEALRMGWGSSHLSQPHSKPRSSLLGGGTPTTHEPRSEAWCPHYRDGETEAQRGELASGDSFLVRASQSPCQVSGHSTLPLSSPSFRRPL